MGIERVIIRRRITDNGGTWTIQRESVPGEASLSIPVEIPAVIVVEAVQRLIPGAMVGISLSDSLPVNTRKEGHA